MAQAHGRNAGINFMDTAGTRQNLAGDLNNIQLTWSRDNSESTTLGKDSKQRISGIRDATLTGAAVWNSGTNNVDSVMSGIMAASLITLVTFAPGGSVTSSPCYSGCMLVSNWSVTAPLNGVTAAAFTFQLASGSITTGTI